MSLDPHEVARLFDLGRPVAAPRPLPGLSTARVWALDTERGRWVVKTARPAGAGEFAAMRSASTLESAALAAGVACAQPVPIGSATGYWAPLPQDRAIFVRVSERVDGTVPEVPLPAGVAAWLGVSVARITGLALPGGDDQRVAPDWAGELAASDLRPAARAQLQAAVTDATALVEAAGASRPATVLAHRDISRHNVLLTTRGPVLLDFDRAGPAVAWWDLVHHAFLFGCLDLGPQEPDEACVRTAVGAYLAAGGVPGPAEPAAFAGLLGGLLDWTAVSLRAAATRAPAATALNQAAASRAALNQAAVSLPLILAAIPRWSALLA